MKHNSVVSTSRETMAGETSCIEKKRETAKPLEALCKAYKCDYDKALDASFANRLKLFRIDGVIYCKTKDLRAYLEEAWKIGLYTETKYCPECGKDQPLYFFCYDEDRETGHRCRDCQHHRDVNKKKCQYSHEDTEDETLVLSDRRAYKSADEFVGKVFIVETKRDGNIVDSSTMVVEAVVPDADGKMVTLVGIEDGRANVQRLTRAEVKLLCSEEVSLYWSENSDYIYKKVLILNDN